MVAISSDRDDKHDCHEIRKKLEIFLSIGLFLQCQGLHLDVSRKDALLTMGTNVSISCSDKRPFDMDWLLDNSHLSSCSLRSDLSNCLPGGRFVVSLYNDTFQLNLVNLDIKDCGTYTCKTRSDQKTHTLRLIERVKMAQLSESDHALAVTTSCIVPGYSVGIRWYYIPKDGKPRLYDQPTSRLERTEECSGACLEDNMVRVSSTLQLPRTVKRPLTVKLRATIIQDGDLLHYTSARDYTIEGCPRSNDDDYGILAMLCLICIMCVLHLGAIIYRVYKNDSILHDWDILYRALISGVVLVYDIADMVLVRNGIRLPGACDIQYSVHHVPAVVGYFLIASASVVMELLSYRKTIINTVDKVSYHQRTQFTPAAGIEEQTNTTELEDDNHQILNKSKQSNEGSNNSEKETLLDQEKTSESSISTLTFAKQWEKECNTNLLGSVCNEGPKYLSTTVGQKTILRANRTNRTTNYPSWQKLNGDILNYGGRKKFLPINQKLTWLKDNASIMIHDVQPSDAGTYLCFYSGGEVYIVDLFVYLPQKEITTSSRSSCLFDVDKSIQGPYPKWSRDSCVINTRFHEKFNETKYQWHKDAKSLIVKNIGPDDEGLYRVSSNNCIQEFDLRVKLDKKGPVGPLEVEAGMTVRLECPNEDNTYPSWHCVNHNIYNLAGSPQFMQPYPVDNEDLTSRLGWSVDKRSLLIQNVRMRDSGAYLCRMADGTYLTINLVVKIFQKIARHRKKEEFSLPCAVSDHPYPCWSGRDTGCHDLLPLTTQGYPDVPDYVTWDEDKKGLCILDSSKLPLELRCSIYGGPLTVFKQF